MGHISLKELNQSARADMKSISCIYKIHCDSFVWIMLVIAQIFSKMNSCDIKLLCYRASSSFIMLLEAMSFLVRLILMTFCLWQWARVWHIVPCKWPGSDSACILKKPPFSAVLVLAQSFGLQTGGLGQNGLVFRYSVFYQAKTNCSDYCFKN